MDTRKKIIDLDQLAERVGGKRWTAACGRFDVLTADHCKALEAAREQGDYLVVLLSSDHACGDPVLKERERAQLAAAVAAVDAVLICDQSERIASSLAAAAVVDVESQVRRDVVSDVLSRHPASE